MKRVAWLAVAALLVAVAWDIDADPVRLARGLPWMWDFVRRMVPPDFRVLPSDLKGAVGTIEIALLGTGLAAALAIPLGFLSARNVAPPALYYVVRTALIPVVTLIALQLPIVFGGAIVTEQIFRVPGIGSLLISAMLANDTPVVTLGGSGSSTEQVAGTIDATATISDADLDALVTYLETLK